MEFKFLHKWIFTNERFGISFKDLVKETLEYLKVPYEDECCGQTFVPMAVNNPANLSSTSMSITENEITMEAIKSLYVEIQNLKTELEELKEKIK